MDEGPSVGERPDRTRAAAGVLRRRDGRVFATRRLPVDDRNRRS